MIYLGSFMHVTNQEEVEEQDRRHGEFSLIVQAANGPAAIESFKRRLLEYRDQSDLFAGRCSIYLVQLLEFDNFPQVQAIMLNYKSVAGDPVMPFIRCSIPNQESDTCRIFDWRDNRPEIDGVDEQLFLEFAESAR
jgi:hypothetical protein